jgi:hypothetical protein
MRAAKSYAAERGERLKDLFIRALAHEVGRPIDRRASSRVVLPIIGRDVEPGVDVSNVDIEAALGAEDAEKYTGR